MPNNLILLVVLLFTVDRISLQETNENTEELSPTTVTLISIEQCKYIDLLNVLKCEDVDNLTSITANQAQVSSINSLYVKPKNLISFDASFSFSNSILDKFQENFDVNLENFNGFAFPSNPFRSIYAKSNTLFLSDIYLDFFSTSHNNTLLNELCIFFPNEIKPLFSSFQRILLDKTVKFNASICPLIFKDANLARFIISSVSERNNFQFVQLSQLQNNGSQLSALLNSSIKSFEVFQSSIKILNRSLIDPFVFVKTESIVYHSLESNLEIQDDLFDSFTLLKSFEISVPDFSKFFKFRNLTWIYSLNNNVSIDLTNPAQLLNQEKNFKLILKDLSQNVYNYPDVDFCVFVDFPHHKRVFPIFETTSSLDCSCLILWLTLYYPYYDELPTLTGTKCDYKENFNQSVAKCNFEEKKLNCANPNVTTVISTISTNPFSSTFLSNPINTTNPSNPSSTTNPSNPSSTTNPSNPSSSTNPSTSSLLVEKCEYFSDSSLLKCNEITNLSNVKPNQSIQNLFIRPKYRLRFDRSLDFSGAETNFKKNFQVILQNFDGFNLNANPFQRVSETGGNLEIYESNFDFFSSNHESNSLSELCFFVSTSYDPLFSSFKNLILGSELDYFKPLCPLIFKGSRLERLIVSNVSGTNYLRFSELKKLDNQTESLSSLLNSSIQSFEVFKSSLKRLENDFLNELVFEKLENFKYFSLERNLDIQNDLFKSFKFLKEFELYVPNLSTLLIDSSQEWISSINFDTRIDLSPVSLMDPANKNKQFKLKLWETSSSYLFPDEDLCYFKDFPHNQLIFPIIEDVREIYCSCTVIFITQFYPYFKDFENLIEKSSFKCNYTNDFELLIKRCNFEEEVAKCNSPNITTSSIPTSVKTNSAAPITTSSFSTTNKITVIEINDDNNTGVIVGSVIGGLGGLTLITILFYFLFLKLKKRQTKIEPNGEQEMKKV